MSAELTYQLRKGLIAGVVAGKHFNLFTYQDQSTVVAWEGRHEFHPGKITLWDHSFERLNKDIRSGKSITDSVLAGKVGHKLKIGDNGKLEVYDWPETQVGRFEGTGGRSAPGRVAPRPKRNLHHSHCGPAVFIKDEGSGFYIHGWPPCNIKRCIIVTHQWDVLFKALAEEGHLNFYIEY